MSQPLIFFSYAVVLTLKVEPIHTIQYIRKNWDSNSGPEHKSTALTNWGTRAQRYDSKEYCYSRKSWISGLMCKGMCMQSSNLPEKKLYGYLLKYRKCVQLPQSEFWQPQPWCLWKCPCPSPQSVCGPYTRLASCSHSFTKSMGVLIQSEVENRMPCKFMMRGIKFSIYMYNKVFKDTSQVYSQHYNLLQSKFSYHSRC